MKRALGIILGAVLTGVTPNAASAFSLGVDSSHCREDREIPAAQRTAIDVNAIKFVRSILGEDIGAAYPMMTKEAQKAVGVDKLAREIALMVQSAAPFADPKVDHTYVVQSMGTEPVARAVCGSLANNDWVSVAVRPGPTQAHVVITSRTRNNDWAFTLWLFAVKDAWKVAYFHMGISSIVGITPEALLERARHERDAGHAFNAAMLYAGVEGAVDRGPDFQLGIIQALKEDLATFSPPHELSGKPPFTWKMEGHNYVVSQASILGVQNQLGLVFNLPHQKWSDDQDADHDNREFLKAFVANHPDFSRAFAFLLARALKPDNSGGFGTVYQVKSGFN